MGKHRKPLNLIKHSTYEKNNIESEHRIRELLAEAFIEYYHIKNNPLK